MTEQTSLLHEKLDDLMEFPQGEIYTKVLYKSENFSAALLCLARGQVIDAHSSTGKAALQVVRGRGCLKLKDESIVLQPGTFLFIPPHLPHSLAADENLGVLLCLSHMLSWEKYKLKH